MKIPSEMDDGQAPTSSGNQKFDKSCTSSVYISQPSVSVSNGHVSNDTSNNNNNDQTAANQNRAIEVVTTTGGGGEAPRQPKPVLTIQVNQNTISNQSSSNLVNIVSCFRAYPNAHAHVTAGNENPIENNLGNVRSTATSAVPFSVSVNRTNGDFITKSSVSGGESVNNNENNQNIINIDASLKHDHQTQSSSSVKREVDLNEICVEDNHNLSNNGDIEAPPCNAKSNNHNVDYIRNSSSTTKLEIKTNGLPSTTDTSPVDDGNEIERKVPTSNSDGTGPNVTNANVINHTATIETVVVDVESKEDRSSISTKHENDNATTKSTESQSHREQRRRERRERRQARQRAQHGHHHITTAPIHHQRAGGVANAHPTNASTNGIRTFNGPEPSRTGHYDILPDIVNIQPPPYTSLPSPSAIHTITPISPVPVVVDDCRFSFPIPIIRR